MGYVTLLKRKQHEQIVKKYLLIDHCFISQNQIFEANILESTLGVDHSTIVYQSSLRIDHSDKKRQFLIRNTKK